MEHVYTVASHFPEDSVFGRMARDIRNTLRGANISFKQPKLGDHITYVSPFVLEEAQALWLAKGLHIAQVFAEESPHSEAKITSWGFLGDNNEALAVLFQSSRDFRHMVEYLRASIPYGAWVNTPDKFSMLAHATVAEAIEGDPLFHAGVQNLSETVRNSLVMTNISVRFGAPKLYKKTEKRTWAPVHF